MTTIAQKADYVRDAIREDAASAICGFSQGSRTCGLLAGHEGKHNPGHTCHWPGCGAIVSPAQWGCRSHWYKLPQGIRNRIWAAFRPGQEISKTPSEKYVEAARAAQDWIVQRGTP